MLKTIYKLYIGGIITLLLATAMQNPKAEYAVKGAILCKICSYAKWPALNNEVFIIGIVGQLPEGGQISIPTNYKIAGKNVELRKIENTSQVTQCNAIFVCEQNTAPIQNIIELAHQNEVLTFCDKESVFQQGSMFHLVMIGSKVKFEINRKSIRESNVSLSAPIYEVALRIIE